MDVNATNQTSRKEQRDIRKTWGKPRLLSAYEDGSKLMMDQRGGMFTTIRKPTLRKNWKGELV